MKLQLALPIFLFFQTNVVCASVYEVQLCPGFIKRLDCPGTLKTSAIGNAELIELKSAATVGCSVFVRPLATEGITNLELRTSAGSISALLIVKPNNPKSCAEPFQFQKTTKGD